MFTGAQQGQDAMGEISVGFSCLLFPHTSQLVPLAEHSDTDTAFFSLDSISTGARKFDCSLPLSEV